MMVNGNHTSSAVTNDDIVISGIAGVYPESDNICELADNLFAKRDLVTDDERRWKREHPEIPQRTGKIKTLNKFDAAFFGVHAKQANSMDPMGRILLEKTFEAVVDAGYNPRQLKGSKTGVFVAVCFSDSEKSNLYDRKKIDGCGITGCSRAMFANRLSFWLDVNGPSYAVDTACSSSMYALEHGYRAIKDGLCETAIVCGCNLCLHPYISLQYARLGVCSVEGKCKSFDETGSGYCRSEAVVVVILQKRKNARRIYARVVHVKTNCDGYTEQGITCPSLHQQTRLLEEFYKECDVDPNSVDYFEAHGTGTRVGDPIEVKSIETVLCGNRQQPLKIGAIKSNMGHAEPTSGLCSISKVILSFELGQIPPNIHLQIPRSDIEAFHNGKMKIITEATPIDGSLAAVNNFGFGGANGHALLQAHSKLKINDGMPADVLPRLIAVSGRTAEAVDVILNDFERRPLDVEYVRLMQEIHSENIPGHLYRGYILLSKNGKLERHVEHFSGEKRPVWFVFAGMGSQWLSMGSWLLKIPVCAAALYECEQILKKENIDLINVITAEDTKIFDNILNSFVGISAIQVALIDLLHSLNVKPDGIIGHSLGELACAYTDGCFTKEQIMMAAYYRGKASIEGDLIHGMMASIGLGYEDMKHVIPCDIDIACHNAPNNCTISGPTDSVKKFTTSLNEQNIFVREVNVSNIAYHSRYVAKAGPTVLRYMKKVIPKPTLRSKNWICTSQPESKWDTTVAHYSSAEYYTNNLINSVYFEEASRRIPENAIVIEIAPHGLLQPILKRSLGKDVTNIALTNRRSTDNLNFLFTALGKFFEVGGNPQLHNLYPPVEFPVSRGTPMISPLIRWQHNDDWFVPSYQVNEENQGGGRNVSISMNDENQKYLAGHCIDGRILYPATGYLVLVWETLSQGVGRKHTEVAVLFENVRFEKPLYVPMEDETILTITIQSGSGNFEIIADKSVLVVGKVQLVENINEEFTNLTLAMENGSVDDDENNNYKPGVLRSDDVYKELRLRGYNYTGLFKGIACVDKEGTRGRIVWKENFVTFLDNILQLQILNEDTRNLKVPVSIQKIVIDPKKFANTLKNSGVAVQLHSDLGIVQCAGIEVQEIKTASIARRSRNGKLVFQKYWFVPYLNTQKKTTKEIMKICTHIAVENVHDINLKIIELVGDNVAANELFSSALIDIFDDIPTVQADIIVHARREQTSFSEKLERVTVLNEDLPNDGECSMIVTSNILNDEHTLLDCFHTLKPNGFLLSRESGTSSIEKYSSVGFSVCATFGYADQRFVLLHKVENYNAIPLVLKITNNSFQWINKLQQKLKILSHSNRKLIIYSDKEEQSGILGFVNCLKKEVPGSNLRCFFIVDKSAPIFSIDHPFYKAQLAKDLVFNVYSNGQWGSYRHTLLATGNTATTPHAYVTSLCRGDLSSLKWIEGPINPLRQTQKSEIVHVYCAPLNFRDIMMATGRLASETLLKNRLQGECTQGFEYSGKLANGQRVMGIVPGRAIASVVEGDVHLCWNVPDEWSLEEAATVPVVYTTVLRALITCGRMKRGDSILIHAGSGGVGQAAINVCLQFGCTIFTTVGTKRKREFIRTTFPSIPEDHIGNSRDTSFQQLIMKKTKGKGVDLVLNSLADDKLQASVRCLGHLGRFLEIGRVDIAKNTLLGMQHFEKEITFCSVLIDKFFYASRERKLELKSLLDDALVKGLVKPLVREVFHADQVEAAFRYMASGKHIGKVILKIRDEEATLNSKPDIMLKEAIPRVSCSPHKSYIICGGLGGFGLELADWLILRGARNVILTTRRGITTGYQAWRLKLWKSYGVNVVVSINDMTSEENVDILLKLAVKYGPVGGIFNLAVVLKDAIFDNQNEESFKVAWRPKAEATMYLDKLSRDLCPQLEIFVVFSSIVSGYGNVGQTNYGMANSIMERICEARRADGFPAVAIQWGAIADVGIVAEMAQDKELVVGGTLPQSISSCLESLDVLLRQPEAVVSCLIVADKQQAEEKIHTIIDIVANILGIKNLKTISMHSTLSELGTDSMMNTEIKQILDREMKTCISVRDVRRLTFAKLEELILIQRKRQMPPEKNLEKNINKSEENAKVSKQILMELPEDKTEFKKPIMSISSLLGNGIIS